MFNYFLLPTNPTFISPPPNNSSFNATTSQSQVATHQAYQQLQEKYDKLKGKFEALKEQNKNLKNYINELEELFKPELKKKKVRRRMENELVKEHKCPYPLCKKQYASALALNLHIRNKHDGGTKKQRVAYIKQIMIAQNQGQEALPPTNLNIPPEVIQFELKLYNQRGNSENGLSDSSINSGNNQERFRQKEPSIFFKVEQ